VKKHNSRPNPTGPEQAGERDLLRKIERAAWPKPGRGSGYGVRSGIGDDAALWRPRAGFETILTTDWFLEGTHFSRKFHPADAVGWKCLARAVSDVAAMGGEPRCFLLNLALPGSCTGKWIEEFLGGLRRASRRLGCPLVGGDTTRRNEILINLCVVGEVKEGRAVKRLRARAGDRIFVSGRLGEAELGLRLLEKKKQAGGKRASRLFRKHLYPEPRTGLGRWLGGNRIATAMMDLSDGLSSDLARFCEASGVGARIYLSKLPLASEIFSREFNAAEQMNAALHGGDDYELLFSVPSGRAAGISRKFSGIRLTEIGDITTEAGIRLIKSSGEAVPLSAGGWDPFRK